MKKENIPLIILAVSVIAYALTEIMGVAGSLRLFMVFPFLLVLWPIPGAYAWSWVDGLDPDSGSPAAILTRILVVSLTFALFLVPVYVALKNKRRWPFAIAALVVIWILVGGLYGSTRFS